MSRRRTPWTQSEVDDYIAAHEARMQELQYPPEILKEFRRARDRWLMGVSRA